MNFSEYLEAAMVVFLLGGGGRRPFLCSLSNPRALSLYRIRGPLMLCLGLGTIGTLLVLLSNVLSEQSLSDSEYKYFFNEIHAVEAPQLTEATTLQYVQIVFRHGDRTPSVILPNDPNNQAETWREGLGELTTKGIQQQYRLGQWFRKRYDKFLGETLDRKALYVRSSDYARTLMSAEANLAGFFPPPSTDKWSNSIPWMPIPVHTVQGDNDYQLNENINCPAAKKATDSMSDDPKIKQIEADHATLFKYLEENSGIKKKPLRLRDMWYLFDPLNCEYHHQDTHSWPTWMNTSMWERVRQLYDESAQFMFHMETLRRLRGGPLVEEMFDRFQQKVNGSLEKSGPRKIYIYSAHDTTVAATLSTLGIVPRSFPVYATAVMMELHMRNGEYTVEVYYKNETDVDTVYRLAVPGCEDPCTLDKLHEDLKQVFPEDWRAECGLKYSTETNLWVAVILLGVCCSILLGLIVSDVLIRRRRQTRRVPMSRKTWPSTVSARYLFGGRTENTVVGETKDTVTTVTKE